MYNYNHLYYFYLTAKHSSVTSAAGVLRIAQPSLSAQLKVLEKQLQHKLFVRVGRRLELTEQGHRVYSYCRRMFEIADDLEHAMQNEGMGQRTRLRIGVIDEIDRPFVVETVSQIVKNESKKNTPVVAMTSDRHVKLLEQLRSQMLDVILTNQPVYDQDLETLSSTSMPVLLTYSKNVGASVKIPKRGTLDLKEVLEYLPKEWVMPASRQRLRAEADSFLEKRKVATNVIFESDVLASVARAIVDGVGVGLLPFPYVAKEVSRGAIECYGPESGYWQHYLWLVARKRREQDPVIRDLIAIFKKSMNQGKYK